jgi:hypothetical protein
MEIYKYTNLINKIILRTKKTYTQGALCINPKSSLTLLDLHRTSIPYTVFMCFLEIEGVKEKYLKNVRNVNYNQTPLHIMLSSRYAESFVSGIFAWPNLEINMWAQLNLKWRQICGLSLLPINK